MDSQNLICAITGRRYYNIGVEVMFKHLKDLYKCLYDNPWQRDTAIIIKWMLVFMVFYSIFTGIIFLHLVEEIKYVEENM